jgi:hypothetical protein
MNNALPRENVLVMNIPTTQEEEEKIDSSIVFILKACGNVHNDEGSYVVCLPGEGESRIAICYAAKEL